MAHLASAGRSTTDDLKLELGLDTRGYQRVRRLLEGRGAIVSRSVTVDAASGGHVHMSQIMRWDQVVDDSSRDPEEALDHLLGAVVDAAVLIPEREVMRALTWTIPKAVLERAIDNGRVRRVSKDLLGAPIS